MKRTFITDIKPGSSVKIAGWIDTIRDQGSIAFVIIRDKSGSIQVTIKDDDLLKQIDKASIESVVTFSGIVEEVEQAPGGFELKPNEMEVISKADTPLPFQPTGEEPVNLDTRLDNRFIDLRKQSTRAKFSVVEQITETFSRVMRERDFEKIYPPGIIGTASEGGSELFSLPYFDKTAFLAQSPQLYKQMCVIGGMERVFDISRIWRAEESHTSKHLTEAIQLDMEMGFADAGDVIKIGIEFLQEVESDLSTYCADNLEEIGTALDMSDPEWISYTRAIELLQESGHEISWGSDLSTSAEKKLSEIIGWDTPIVVDKWPDQMKPFYIMPSENDLSEGFDILFRGVELASGGQRIHDPSLLEERIAEEGMSPENFEDYIRTFRFGSPPHAGWAIGLERLCMTALELDNIREAAIFPRDPERITP
jgi:aspartyl-tRNA synthetase